MSRGSLLISSLKLWPSRLSTSDGDGGQGNSFSRRKERNVTWPPRPCPILFKTPENVLADLPLPALENPTEGRRHRLARYKYHQSSCLPLEQLQRPQVPHEHHTLREEVTTGTSRARGSKGGQGAVTDEAGREYIRKVLAPPPPPAAAMGRWPGYDITRWHGAAHTAALPAQPGTAPRPRIALLVPAELSPWARRHAPLQPPLPAWRLTS